ncbi:hypothetical protein NCC49_005371, partial [Naganishia albida]
MSTTNAPKIPKLVSHAQFVACCFAVDNAILAAGAHASLREVVAEPVRPVGTEKLVVTATDLQVYVAELAYYRSWKDKEEKARRILFQNVSNGLRMKLQGRVSAKEAWEQLGKLHQVDDEDYRADIQNQRSTGSTITMTQADDPETFVERYETLLLTAQVAKLNISEAAKCSDFLRALPASYDNLRSEWRTVSRFAKAEDDKTYDVLSQLFNTHVIQLQRQTEKEQPAVMFIGRQGNQEGDRPKIGDGRSHRPARDRGKAKPVAKDKSGSNMDDIMALSGEESLIGAVTRVPDDIKEHGAILSTVQDKTDGKILWIIDSGATAHVWI